MRRPPFQHAEQSGTRNIGRKEPMSAASTCEKGETPMEIRAANPMPANSAEAIVITCSEETFRRDDPQDRFSGKGLFNPETIGTLIIVMG